MHLHHVSFKVTLPKRYKAAEVAWMFDFNVLSELMLFQHSGTGSLEFTHITWIFNLVKFNIFAVVQGFIYYLSVI